MTDLDDVDMPPPRMWSPPEGIVADIMDDIEALLHTGSVPLARILDMHPELDIRLAHSLLTSKDNPRRQMLFKLERGASSSDVLYRITWLLDGIQVRSSSSDGAVCCTLPSEVLFTGLLGRPAQKVWTDAAGQRHRDDGPAVISFFLMEWWCHGKKHRDGGPAVHIRQWDSRRLMWFVDGVQHRGGNHPADMESWEGDNGGRIVYQEFRDQGKLVRWEQQAVSCPLDVWIADNQHFLEELGREYNPW